MPTAGEYKHEPSGIPCHCYVRRRLHHSTCRKSCLRNKSDGPSPFVDTKLKKVTFNPILRVRSYDNQPETESESNTALKDIEKRTETVKSRNQHDRSDNSMPYNKQISSLDSNQQCKLFHEDKNTIRRSLSDTFRKDCNNNVIDQGGGDKMHSKKICPICESKRNKSPVRGYHYQQYRDRSPSPCGFHQQYQIPKGTTEQSQHQKNVSHNPHTTPSLPPDSKYHIPRRLFKRDSFTDSSTAETSSQKDSSGGYENMNSLTYVTSVATNQDGSSVYINGSTDKKLRPVSLFIKGDREEDKLEEYIYEVPVNNKDEHAEYDYITVDPTNKAQSDKRKDTAKSTYSITRLIRHKTEADLTSANIQDYTLRPKNSTRRSAPDLQTIASPYEIHLVNERPRHPSPTDDEPLETFAASDTIDKSEISTFSKLGKNNSPVIDILKMTPIAFFWTGCAFLIAMVYVFLFSCPYEHSN